MQVLKITEIIAAGVGIAGLVAESVPVLLTALFLFGLQSALFSPSKYSTLPQHLKDRELLAGNALIESGVFFAIITGLIGGGLMLLTPNPTMAIGIATMVLAAFGLATSMMIPTAPPQGAERPKLDGWKPTAIWQQLRHAAEQPVLFNSILGISWFNMVGGVLLAQLPLFAKSELGASESMTTLLFVAFTVGIGVGALMTERLLKGEITGQLAPVALLVLSLFLADLALIAHYPPSLLAGIGDASIFATILSEPRGWRLLLDLAVIAAAAAIFVVPLYALLQHEAKDAERARIIAASNVLNAVFIVVGCGVGAALLKLGLSPRSIIGVLAGVNVLAALYAVKLVPVLVMRGTFRTLLTLLFRLKVEGASRLKALDGPAVFVANHVSYLDGIILGACLPGRPVFAVHTHVAEKWWARLFLSLVDFKPIDPTNPLALKSLIEEVRRGRSVAIFPEGRITRTGALMKVYEGPGMIAEHCGVPLVPIRIDGPQFSKFSHMQGRLPLRWFPKVRVTIEKPVTLAIPEDADSRTSRRLVATALYDVLSNVSFETANRPDDLYGAVIASAHRFGWGSEALGDVETPSISYRKMLAGAEALGKKLAGRTDRDERIGVILPTSIGCAVTVLALEAHGRVPAMLNFTAGNEGALKAIEAATLTKVLTSRRFVEKANLQELIKAVSAVTEVIFLEDIRQQVGLLDKLSAMASTFFLRMKHKRRQIDPNAPALVLFTSGSEGAPKGVVLSHMNLLSNCRQIASRVDFTPRDKVLNALPMFHSFGFTGGTLLPLIYGVPSFLYPSPLHYRIVPELAYSFNATIMFGTDTFLAGYARMAHAYDFYAMRMVFAGAERVRPETRKVWMEKFGVRIMEGYGTTETAPVIAVNTPMHNKAGTVGRLLPGSFCRLEDVPGIDEGGRLHVAGPNIMLGYLKVDTPGVLVPAAEGPAPGTRWHDTGDIVTIDEDGFITIRGRAKRFAKIAGEMVSLAAVEALAEQAYPERVSAVVSRNDGPKGERIILCVEGEKVDLDALRKAAKERGAPELMVPRDQLPLKEMPLLGSGKIDHVTLNKLVEAELGA